MAILSSFPAALVSPEKRSYPLLESAAGFARRLFALIRHGINPCRIRKRKRWEEKDRKVVKKEKGDRRK